MGLSIISWNVNFLNVSHPQGLAQLIEEKRPDVVCVQEVPEEFLDELPVIMGYEKFSCLDRTFTYRGRKIKEYLVILSACSVTDFTCHELEHTKGGWGVHFGLLTKQTGKFSNFSFQCVTIQHGGEELLIGNVHIPLFTSSSGRLQALEEIFSIIKRSGKRCLLAGDFNILDALPLRMGLGWFLGMEVKEFRMNERTHLETLQRTFAYQNVHKGERTVERRWLGILQLDHILIPESMDITHKEVLEDTYGSDHFPIFIGVDDDSWSQENG